MQNPIFNAIVALGAVLLLVAAAAWLARRVRPLRTVGAGRLQVLGSLALDPRRRLHIISCDGRSVLLLTGPADLVIGWLPEPRP